MHKCIICGSNSEEYFTKTFNTLGLTDVVYHRCVNCGFVFSKTHVEMSKEEWCKLNEDFHNEFFGDESPDVDPKWLSRLDHQANLINELVCLGVLKPTENWIDYGCGDGKLSDMLKAYNIKLKKFDRYMFGDDYLGEDAIQKNKYDVVVNTSVFEHVLTAEHIDEIMSLVNDNGVLALHTYINNEVPADPEWFYLVPVHCAFHTNKSMQILFDKYNFKYSIYDLKSRMWFLFKDKYLDIVTIRDNGFPFKRGFLDYWK